MQRPLPPNRLREFRQSRPEVELYDLAARLRVAVSTIHRWETGASPVPDWVKLELAEFYGVSPAYLMGWPEDAAA
ncbi:MAG TPA: helix-turn-helix transcriptional regulator [Solirubrobacteraceae bacterium]|jgi:transcriptional regulator with XRE-family HTH domain|nr:helix-turn-helix transcriptional regulator [Solirubrobacteraceae bacterium]